MNIIKSCIHGIKLWLKLDAGIKSWRLTNKLMNIFTFNIDIQLQELENLKWCGVGYY